MPDWRDTILSEFAPHAARLTLVADPDGLLLEEGVLKGVESCGFELIPFDDHAAFRFTYESRYRSHWDRGELTDLVVVLRAAAADLGSLPYDLLRAGRKLFFSLAQLFPNLSLRVVEALDRSDLDALYDAQQRERLDHPLGENQTLGFVLRHIFGVAPETIRNDVALLRLLLERHYKGQRVPPILDAYLISKLRERGGFDHWPLDVIVGDREGFFTFLQERWRVYLDRLPADVQRIRDVRSTYGFEVPGPADLPFEHHDVRVYIDNLFLEGMLDPIPHERFESLSSTWASVGLQIPTDEDRLARWARLIEKVEASIPEPAAMHNDWQKMAPRWARLIALRHALGDVLVRDELDRFSALRDRIDTAFLEWVRDRFGTLHNQPAFPPVMVHHMPRLIARHLEQAPDARAALLIVDGLSLDQWVVLHDVLRRQRPALRFRQDTVFSWIPTLTMVSRQAAFAGRPPLHFSTSIHTTDREPALWKRFWEDEGLTPDQVGYEKNLRDRPDLERVEHLTSRTRIRIVGLVADRIDRIMHGMELGTAGMHNQVRQWAEQGVVADLLDLLLDRGFDVFLTADHGNIEAIGGGQPREGSLADLRGQRARVFNDPALRARIHDRFPGAIAWPPLGLPSDYYALLAPGRSAFVREGETLVGHGGVTVEEVIVPFVRIERRR